MQKLGMKPVPGIVRVTVKKSKNILFVIKEPDVFKTNDSNPKGPYLHRFRQGRDRGPFPAGHQRCCRAVQAICWRRCKKHPQPCRTSTLCRISIVAGVLGSSILGCADCTE